MAHEPATRPCRNCKHWTSYAAFFDDPLEPDDYGPCMVHGLAKRDDETCECWELSPWLEGCDGD